MAAALDHTHVTVRSLDRALEFYEGMLGLEVVWDTRSEPPSPELEQLVRGLTGRPDCRMQIVQVASESGHVIELLEYEQPPGRELRPMPGDHGAGYPAFRVRDLRGLHRRLREAGYRCYSPEPLPITLGPLQGGLVALIADADFVPVELIEPPV